MDSSSQRSEVSEVETTKLTPVKSGVKQTKGKPALSPIEEETDTPDSSGDSTVNYHDIEIVSTTMKKYPYDLRVGLRNDCEQVLDDTAEETARDERQDESPPFLTARNTSDHDGKYCDSSATTSNERNSDDDEEGAAMMPEDSSLAGESTSGDVDYYCQDDYHGNDTFDAVDDYDLEILAGVVGESKDSFETKGKMERPNRRPKSAPSCSQLDSSDTSRDDKFAGISRTLDWLKAKIVKSERDIFDLKKQLTVEKIRGRKLARRYEDDRNVTRESLRIDLELWIKKLNDGLKAYLGEWQKRERLRLNEEISRISDLYSQEITKSLKTSLKEWQTEDTKNLYRIIGKHEKSRENIERTNAKVVYEKIQTHLENLEKRNRKSYATLCKQIDKWEKRLRDEIVKLHEEDLKKLRQQVNTWCEEDCRRKGGTSIDRQKSKERFTEAKRNSPSFGAEALLQVEENLLKRLRASSSKDLRRTEEIVRTEMMIQRRELAKRMNVKINELWMDFEEVGSPPNIDDHERSGGRKSLEHRVKDIISKPEVSTGRSVGERIVSSKRSSTSNINNNDFDDDRDRMYGDDRDEDETTAKHTTGDNISVASNLLSTLTESSIAKGKNYSMSRSTHLKEK